MPSRLHLGCFLALAVGAWVLLLLVRGTPVTWDHLWPFTMVLAFLGFSAACFEKHCWSWRGWRGWFIQRPDLRGTWQVVLKSDWVNPKTGEKPPPITCYMSVRQTLTTLSMRLMTPESSSVLIAHKIECSNDGIHHVAGVYRNEPKLELRGDRSEIHYGAIWLEVQGDPPTSLEGHYWTDRSTRGTMLFTRRVRVVYVRFAEAHAAFPSSIPVPRAATAGEGGARETAS